MHQFSSILRAAAAELGRAMGPPGLRRVMLALAVVLAGVAIGLGAAAWRYSLPSFDLHAPAIRVYAEGRPIAVAYPWRRAQDWVPLDRIPRPVVDAVVAAEDRRFWSHPGIDVLAVGRAFRGNLKRGEVREGASTITQQLARTLFLNNERNWTRKLHEAVIAILLELRYSKRQILEAYLNTVYFGHDADVSVHGVSAASQHFVGKDVTSVSVDEAAWLASAIRAPNRLRTAPSAEAKRRRDEIIQAMEQQGSIDATAARRALAQPLRRRPPDAARMAPYFVDAVSRELERRSTVPESGTIDVRTTLSLSLQRAAEAAVRDGIARMEKKRPELAGRVQAAVVAIEPESGRIRALVGGRRYPDAPFNHATRAVRQPGSLFKPFVYVAAFELEGRGGSYTPASVIDDEPLAVQTRSGNWEPQNIDGQFHGPVTLRRALEESLNVPAVRLALNVGPERVASVARAMGIDRPLLAVPSLALGTSEVTLLEITTAFATLANQGVRVSPTTLAPEGHSGEPAIAPLPAPARAISPESAFMATHLLRGVMRRGTAAGSSAWRLQEVTAGKTGTTDGLRDAWFVGYTPDLVIGVWVGLDDGSPLGFTGSQAALPIWGPIMQAALRQSPPRPFTPPPGVVLAQVDRSTGRRVSFWCGSDEPVEEAFRVGMVPADDCPSNFRREAATVLDWFKSFFK
ncbi:MAG TPA: PBP1A family penicillin-binding protein [Methylomirabilota bacterium]|jgi:penicillin-binding protein 1B|nr:PBP1A family penicillin-binding protein [Methylomirabilota bacterium]